MKTLFAKHLLLFPRIRKEVKDDLDAARALRVLESTVPLSPSMERIQETLAKLLTTCLEELSRETAAATACGPRGARTAISEPIPVEEALLGSF